MVEYTKQFDRDKSSKALLANDAKLLEKHNKQKAASNTIKMQEERINTLESKLDEALSLIKRLLDDNKVN